LDLILPYFVPSHNHIDAYFLHQLLDNDSKKHIYLRGKTSKMSAYEIVIINLKRSTDRRAKMTDEVSKLETPFRFFDAVDGSTLSDAFLKNKTSFFSSFLSGRKLLKGEIGCYLSHLGVAEDLLKSKADFYIVLEDDCSVSKDLDSVCLALSNTDDWDIVRLEHRHDKNFTITKPLTALDTHHLKRVDWSIYGAVGYALSRSGAEKIVKASKKITYAFDILFTRYWAYDLKYYEVCPPVITWEDEIQSDIDPSLKDNAPKRIRKKNRLILGKKLRNLYDGIRKRHARKKIRKSG